MNGILASPMTFLIDTVFGLYILAVMLRFLLQLVEADFYNPVSQFLVKITHPPLRILRRFIPSFGRMDTASLVLMFALQMLGDYLVSYLQGGGQVAVGALAALSFIQLVKLVFNVFIFAIIIQALLSWINPDPYNPVYSLLSDLTEPVMRPCRRLLPPIGGLDLSPIIAIIGLGFLMRLTLGLLEKLVTTFLF